ncbi:DNA recombination protein RmuC [Seongchinamella sediminis]|uniref:DNA recombination protein RmuC n=1 Tax=Seongchinamella sediminis TaxID=2283635 RepID=A0A3L7DZI0_9GAMM|nr:DNA recombination protein RmuC [Seongchinamella sediminis]RLQ22079.1 DNA recombination protein RmuC [Seongchinamella sediminis]
MTEAEIQQLIVAGAIAVGGLAVGLLIGIVRGQKLLERLRAELTASNEDLQLALATSNRDITALEVERHQLQARLQEQRQSLTGLEQQIQQHNLRYQSLQQEHTRLQTRQEEREEQHKDQMALLKEARDNLKQEFELLANRIFEDKGKHFTSTNRESLESLLKPFREQISGFQSRINEVHTESVKGQSALEAEIRKVLEVGLEMNSQATNLASALKGDKKTTGNWGEAQLERTLELAGLIPGDHYATQESHTDAGGKRRLPDFIIKLPDNKCLVIDSKVSLVDYERAISAETEEARGEALKAHARAVRNHIDDLSGKDYTGLSSLDSPDFVLMFMPVEPAYIEAMKYNRDLFNYGYQRQVVMVSHTTLMPILRTVANLWMIDQSNREAREISARAGEIYNQVCLVAERLHKLGNTLKSANNHYNQTVKGLAGQQGLVGKVDRFRQLSSKASKNLTELEPVHADIELERLEAIELVDPAAGEPEARPGVEELDREKEEAPAEQ